MSLPRELTLDDKNDLIQTPVPELKELRDERYHIEGLSLTNELKRIQGIEGDQLEIVTEFVAKEPDAAFGLKVRCSNDGEKGLVLRYANAILNVAGTEVPLTLEGNRLRLHVFLDKSVMEVFINNGGTSVTRVDYPDEQDLGVAVFAEGMAMVDSLSAWKLMPIW
jgi:beta-fructofuranosidase